VIAATDHRDVNAAVSEAARARALPVNVVDDPELSSFYFPAIVDRAPVIVAVGSAGNAPVLTRRVREQIEALLPATLGHLARFIGERRKVVQRALAPAARRAFWERIVRGTAASRMLQGDARGAQRDFERELRTSQLTASRGTGARSLGEVYLIGAGPGDADLLTLRALQLLQQADVVLYDRLVPEAVLDRARRDARRVFVGKGTARDQRGSHTDQGRIHELMVELARAGLRVARLKGGDPFVFGRGGEEVELLSQQGIPHIVVPGITAALGAAAACAIPLTHRDIAQSVTLVTGHPLEDEALDWSALARPRQTVVFYMGVAQLPRIVEHLQAQGAPGERPAAIVERATLADQRVIQGTLSDIAARAASAHIEAPALLVVGEVVRQDAGPGAP
jgi:uroporphyrin-III C-methyltransferase/precorrin-2 dehydrogenase/sirohydrochlorin ferrochelatase